MPIPLYRLQRLHGQLVQQRFPIGWNSTFRSRRWLILRMRKWWKQLHTLDHPPSPVIVEPVLTRLEAGNDRMPCRRRMPGRMLTWRTVTASDVPTLRTPAEMKPPASPRCQAFDTSVATWLRRGVDPAAILLHFDVPFECRMSSKELKAPAKPSRYRPFLPLLGPRLLH